MLTLPRGLRPRSQRAHMRGRLVFMNAKDWFSRAQKEGWAIGAFNVDNMDIFKAVCLAGKNKKSPVMLEFSQGEVSYFGLKNIVDLTINARKEYGIPILLNLDHAKNVADCIAAVEQAGLDDVHFDGSELPFEENVQQTKKVVESAHKKGLLVEAEIDKIAGSSEVHEEELDILLLKEAYTDPQKAAKFVKETQVDILAAVFGNVHGTFPVQPDLDFALLQRIREAVGETFLSLHGGSGIPADQVKEAIRVGKIVKVNVNTEIRKAYHDAISEKMDENPSEYTSYKLANDVILAVAAVVENKIDVFGSAGKV